MCLTFCDSRRIAGAGCARPVCGRSQETVTRDQPSPFVATRERIGARGLDNAVCTDNRAYIQASCAGRQSRCAHNHRTRHRRGETSDRRNGAQALPRSALVRGGRRRPFLHLSCRRQMRVVAPSTRTHRATLRAHLDTAGPSSHTKLLHPAWLDQTAGAYLSQRRVQEAAGLQPRRRNAPLNQHAYQNIDKDCQ